MTGRRMSSTGTSWPCASALGATPALRASRRCEGLATSSDQPLPTRPRSARSAPVDRPCAVLPVGLRLPLSGPSTAHLSSGDSSYELLAEPAPDGQTIVVGSSLAQVDRILGNMALLLVGIGAAGVIASLAGGWLLSGRALG